jgi:hypothetical protein
MDASGLSYDAATGVATFAFAEGGYQDARGSNDAGDWCAQQGGGEGLGEPPHAHPLRLRLRLPQVH